ncbi:MAG: CbiQ family ECF transporter T component [Synechococcales bacterium]|nr:CbiQ family ECF transporter T component [Synechococcales bacterium]
MDLLRSLPIGLYLEQPVTWLHRIDARIKFLWLLGFLLTPIAASPTWRVAVVVVLLLLTFSTRLPLRVWRRQVGFLLAFSLLLFVVTMLLPDGVDADAQPRLPQADLTLNVIPNEADAGESPTPIPNAAAELPLDDSTDGELANLPQPAGYDYVIVDRGIVHITQRSLELAIRISTLTFTLLYSSNLYLLTTAPEEITAGLENLMQPLRVLRVPVTEIVLTLTLALRFIPLVLEEVQNLARSVRTRAINWKKLGFRGAVQVWLTVAERLLENLLLRAEQIAGAMQVRGFTSPDTHQVRWHQFRLTLADGLVLLGLVLFWVARFAIA